MLLNIRAIKDGWLRIPRTDAKKLQVGDQIEGMIIEAVNVASGQITLGLTYELGDEPDTGSQGQQGQSAQDQGVQRDHQKSINHYDAGQGQRDWSAQNQGAQSWRWDYQKCKNQYVKEQGAQRKPDDSTKYMNQYAGGLGQRSYKTKICRHFKKHGSCWWATSCGFAHGEAELRDRQQGSRRGLVDEVMP